MLFKVPGIHIDSKKLAYFGMKDEMIHFDLSS